MVEIDVGIENFDANILKLNNKHLTPEEIVKNLKKLRATKKLILGYWIIGLPGETKQTLQKNLRMMKKMIKKNRN